MPNPPTSNMALVMPAEGGDAGEWDAYINDAADLIDAHDHTTGKGVRIPTAALNINADLTMASGGTYSAITNAKGVDFQPHAASAMTAYAGCLFTNSSDSNNLYFRTQAGSNVRITNGATLDTTTSGGIGGDYASIPAEVAYVDASDTYTFRQTAAGNWARLQSGPVRISELGTTESQHIEIAAPGALASSYTITPATALPGSTQLVQISSAGALTYTNTVSGLITASAGVTAASGQHVTVSGAGEFKHGDKILCISALSGFATTGAGITNPTGTTYAVSGGAGQDWFMLLPLTVGDRVKSITWYYQRGAGTLAFAMRATTLSTGIDADVGTPASTSSGTTYTSITQSSINKTLVSTETYYLRWTYSATSATNLLYSCQVTYDRP